MKRRMFGIVSALALCAGITQARPVEETRALNARFDGMVRLPAPKTVKLAAKSVTWGLNRWVEHVDSGGLWPSAPDINVSVEGEWINRTRRLTPHNEVVGVRLQTLKGKSYLLKAVIKEDFTDSKGMQYGTMASRGSRFALEPKERVQVSYGIRSDNNPANLIPRLKSQGIGAVQLIIREGKKLKGLVFRWR